MVEINTTIEIVSFFGQVTDAQYIIITEFNSVLWTLQSFLGVVSNVINVRTFIAMGLSDGVTVSLLALSIFDLLYVIASLSLGVSAVFYAIEHTSEIRFIVEPFGIAMLFANFMFLINIANVLTTTFLAVARCMCVAKPLQFKNTFTRKRTVRFIIAFLMVSVFSYAPVLANMGMQKKYDNKLKVTRLAFWVSPNREYIKDIVWLLIDMMLPFSTQLIVLVCVVIMASSLRAASKFRASSVCNTQNLTFIKSNHESTKTEVDSFPDIIPTNISDKIIGKELRVVQQVVLISVVYIVCNTPKILVSIVGAADDDFAVGTRYHNLYLSVNSMRKHFEIFNSSINTIIYYKYNTKFRTNIRF